MIFASPMGWKREARGSGLLGLGQTETDAVRDCALQLGVPENICTELLIVTQGDVEAAYIIMRAGITKVGAVACANALKAEGVPPHLAVPACNWAAENLWKFLYETLPQVGAPTWRALATGRENIHWRRCPSPDGLQPGEHWSPAVGGLPARCMPNVAILQQEGQLAKAVYIPCGQLPRKMSNVEIKHCMDKDGIRRITGVGLRPGGGKTYWPGFYGKRLAEWPAEYENAPWTPPGASPPQTQAITPEARALLLQMQQGTQFKLITPETPPPGSVAVFDSDIGRYYILAPA